MLYQRVIHNEIENRLFKGKAIILVGARQVGKTTFIENFLKHDKFLEQTLFFNCDNPTDQDNLTNKDLDFLVKIIGKKKIVFIDEGQKVENIGNTIKLLVDHFKKEKQIIVTGSSSINLLDSVEESLTGRKFVRKLYPLTIHEIYSENNYHKILKNLETLLIYGQYPEIVSADSFEEKKELLLELTNSYLFKDIFEFRKIKNLSILRNLLKALALQIGSEVSYHELANLLGIDKNTVESYVDLLEKNFVIYRLSPYTKNKRKEISKLRKIYFYDLGIRNTLLNNLNPLEIRNDAGALWENFVITERLKYREYHNISADQYFWRSYQGGEVDLVEDRDGKLFGYEIKWKRSNKKAKAPTRWQEFGNSSYMIINKDNFDELLS